MGKRSVPAAAGILMLIAGIFNVFWLIGVFTHVLDVKALLRATAVISPFPYLILDVGFGGNNLMASLLALIFLLGIVLSIVGGWLTLKRKSRSMALAGAAGACVAAPLAGIVAVVIILVNGSNVKS
ncbi:MAG: hypothetical protein WBQ62_02055 [Dehalococcoidales bacterium]